MCTGFFDGLFGHRLGPEQEQNIIQYVNDFNLAVSKLSEIYTNKAKAEEFSQVWGAAYKEVRGIRVPKKHALFSSVQKFLRDFEHIGEIITSSNAAFVSEEKKRYDGLLSSIDGKSLDDQQRTVVVTDEDRNLVIAGAGSGKTLTIAGKVKYLCDAKGIAPEDILLIAFTRKSATSMKRSTLRKATSISLNSSVSAVRSLRFSNRAAMIPLRFGACAARIPHIKSRTTGKGPLFS